jgi:hypothetical protein
MNMRKAALIAGLVLGLAVLAPATAVGKAGGTDRPISGQASGSTVLDLGTLAFTTDATGVSSHLGKATTHLDGVVTPTGPVTFTIAGSVVFVAANGDELFGTFTGSGTADGSGNSAGTATTTFTGGTGRFADASGTGSGPFTQTLISSDGVTSTLATDLSLSGTISY